MQGLRGCGGTCGGMSCGGYGVEVCVSVRCRGRVTYSVHVCVGGASG